MKILVSRPDKIGDVILAIHPIKELKARIPNAKVYMHISDYTKPLVENIKFIDGIVTTKEEIKKEKFDVVIDLMAKSETAKLFFGSRIKQKIGNSARWFSFMYSKTRYIRRSKAVINEAEYNWQLISMIDRDLQYSYLSKSLDIKDFKEVLLYDEYKENIVLMPSITVSAIGLEVDKWISLSIEASKKYPKNQVIFLLGPAESELEEKIQLATVDIENICIRRFDNFPALTGFLKEAKFFIGTSTGITHLASACGANGVALYPENPSMHPRRWMPFNTKFQVISLNKKPSVSDIINSLENDVSNELNPLNRKKVSAFIICCNEEKNIRRAIESIKWCDEILIVDSGSTDRTLEICREYNCKIIEKDWPGHRLQKQYALDQCAHDWVLNIDSDEEVSMLLRGEIEKVLCKKYPAKGYKINRLIYTMNKWWDKGGWHPEFRMRFFQKKYVKWGGNDPHEKAIVKGRTSRLAGYLHHYTYRDIHHHIECLKTHATNSANCLNVSNKKARFYNIILNPCFRFFKFYVMKSGYREGFPGLIVAVLESYYIFLKYTILWDLNRKTK